MHILNICSLIQENMQNSVTFLLGVITHKESKGRDDPTQSSIPHCTLHPHKKKLEYA